MVADLLARCIAALDHHRGFCDTPAPLIVVRADSVPRSHEVHPQDTWPDMKFQRYAVPGLALLLMAAAPPSAPRAEFPSTWSRIVAGAKRFVHDPLGRAQSAPPTLPPQLEIDGQRTGSAFAGKPQKPSRDEQVRPATAVEKEALDAPAKKVSRPRKSPRTSIFSRERRPSRTLSEYMAEEKP